MIKKFCRKLYCRIIYKVIEKEVIKNFYTYDFEDWFWDKLGYTYKNLNEEDKKTLEIILSRNIAQKG